MYHARYTRVIHCRLCCNLPINQGAILCPKYDEIDETRSLAVAVITDLTAYGVQYSYRPLAGIAVVSMSIYLVTVSN